MLYKIQHPLIKIVLIDNSFRFLLKIKKFISEVNFKSESSSVHSLDSEVEEEEIFMIIEK